MKVAGPLAWFATHRSGGFRAGKLNDLSRYRILQSLQDLKNAHGGCRLNENRMCGRHIGRTGRRDQQRWPVGVMLMVFVLQDPSANEAWQAHLAHEPIDLVPLLAQEQQAPLSGWCDDHMEAARLKQLSEEFAGDRVVFDDKDRGLGSGIRKHLGFPK